MNQVCQLKYSREHWKSKAIDRGEKRRYSERQYKRVTMEREHYKKELIKANAKIKELENERKSPKLCKVDLVHMALQLFNQTHIGFRATSRVLRLLSPQLGLKKGPCPQTIVNWVQRLSLVRMQISLPSTKNQLKSDIFSNQSIWIIDESIALGAGKILAVLAFDLTHYNENAKAVTFQNVRCIGVKVEFSWVGETVADFLQKIIAVLGRPSAFLKDGGGNLSKAVKILDNRGFPSIEIEDISHVVANLLKREYEKHPQFKAFISACGKASKMLKQTVLACLAPPKVSTKSRFMNLHRLVRWADMLLKHSPVGRVRNGSLLEKLRASLEKLPQCRQFISRFQRDANVLLECQKILKNKGLSEETWKDLCDPLRSIPGGSPVRLDFEDWGKRHLKICKALGMGKTGLPITSDQIESLFAIGKQHGVGEIKDANRIGARLPAFCGDVTKKEAADVLGITVDEQEKAFGSLPSLTKLRRQILPNPGTLTEKKLEQEQNLELLPGAKNSAKIEDNLNISSHYEDRHSPNIQRSRVQMSAPKTSPPDVASMV